MSIAIGAVLLVAIILFLVGLSLETLRRFSKQDSLLEDNESSEIETMVPDPEEGTRTSVRYTEKQDEGRSHAQETENTRSLI